VWHRVQQLGECPAGCPVQVQLANRVLNSGHTYARVNGNATTGHTLGILSGWDEEVNSYLCCARIGRSAVHGAVCGRQCCQVLCQLSLQYFGRFIRWQSCCFASLLEQTVRRLRGRCSWLIGNLDTRRSGVGSGCSAQGGLQRPDEGAVSDEMRGCMSKQRVRVSPPRHSHKNHANSSQSGREQENGHMAYRCCGGRGVCDGWALPLGSDVCGSLALAAISRRSGHPPRPRDPATPRSHCTATRATSVGHRPVRGC
jgi:hypothetical protein